MPHPKPPIALRLLLAALYLLASTYLATWSWLAMDEAVFIYSDDNAVKALQFIYEYGWKVLTACCPAWIIPPTMFIVAWDSPYAKKYRSE